MKIVFTGGGTGGHFYPLIAVADQLRQLLADDGRTAELIFMAPDAHDRTELDNTGVTFSRVPAGKMRRYLSLRNVLDLFVTAGGILVALWKLFRLYPDAIFAKGGYGSFPVLVAARILFIPVVIHESDSVPGATNRWAAKFAVRIATSYAEAREHFPEDKTAFTGQPIRPNVGQPTPKENARSRLELPHNTPVILVLGGSQGARVINDTVISTLSELVERYAVVHQAGEEKKVGVSRAAESMLSGSERSDRYLLYGHMDTSELADAAGAADIVISRAGSTIFEIARWGLPSILIPISSSGGDHQRRNAYAYARTGAASVIEEETLSGSVLMSELERILSDGDRYRSMADATEQFVYPDAASIIASELISIASHQTE